MGLKTGGKPLNTVGDLMTRHAITMSPHHSFSDAITLMEKHSFGISGWRLYLSKLATPQMAPLWKPRESML
jgi:CBS domain-containing protein